MATGQPPQTQAQQPGKEGAMTPRPRSSERGYQGCGKLKNKVAIITGGDSGIGKATAIAFAKEGADLVIAYLNEDVDARQTQQLIQQEGRQCLLIKGDIGEETQCELIVSQTLTELGKIDILNNNAAEQHPQDDLTRITTQQWERTFRTNIFSYFF